MVVSSRNNKGTLTIVVCGNRGNHSPDPQMFAQVQQVGPTPPINSHSRSRGLWTNKISPAAANLWPQSQVLTWPNASSRERIVDGQMLIVRIRCVLNRTQAAFQNGQHNPWSAAESCGLRAGTISFNGSAVASSSARNPRSTGKTRLIYIRQRCSLIPGRMTSDFRKPEVLR